MAQQAVVKFKLTTDQRETLGLAYFTVVRLIVQSSIRPAAGGTLATAVDHGQQAAQSIL